MEMKFKFRGITYSLVLRLKSNIRSVKAAVPLEKFKPGSNFEKWVRENYSIEKLKETERNTFGCVYGRCADRCNRACTPNTIRHILKTSG